MAPARAATKRPVRHFSKDTLAAIQDAKLVGVRSGSDHQFTSVWMVVVRDRVIVRSWNDEPTGWRRAFDSEPLGELRVGDRQIKVRARAVRSEPLLKAVDAAYGEKYASAANRQWVRGLRAPSRRATTTELGPR